MLKWYLLLLFFAFGVREGMSQVLINEVMANVKGSESGAGAPGDRNEFVEVYNISPDTIDIDGWFLDDGDARDVLRVWTDSTINDPDVIMNTTRIPPNVYAVILDPEYPDTGDGNYWQPYDFPPSTIILTVGNTTLGNGLSTTDPVSLFDSDTLLTDTYGTPFDTTDSIPFNPGDGISMERIDPSLPDQESNWRPSTDPTGSTPGSENSGTIIETEEVVINEVMANVKGSESGAGAPGDRNEFIELFNVSPDTVNVDRWSFDDGDVIDVLQEWTDPFIQDPDVIINTTKIPPGNYAVILDPDYTEIGDTVEIQLYDFPSNTIILTVGNTTLGDGLNPRDPISLFNRVNFLVDTYGTPDDTTDTIPFDPGDGISMERIDPSYPDQNSNWRPCNDTIGCTPGGENSEEKEEVKVDTFQVVRINILPDPFSPDGDGVNDQTTISFELPFQSAKVRLRIYDRVGRVRNTVVDQETMGNQGSIIWNGRDEGGKILPMGVYILFLEATDDATGRLVTSKKALTLVKRLK
jgi:hypothetical protein